MHLVVIILINLLKKGSFCLSILLRESANSLDELNCRLYPNFYNINCNCLIWSGFGWECLLKMEEEGKCFYILAATETLAKSMNSSIIEFVGNN